MLFFQYDGIPNATEQGSQNNFSFVKLFHDFQFIYLFFQELTADENSLLAAHPKVFNEVSRRHDKRKITETRKQEIEDSPQILDKKCERMAKAIQKVSCIFFFIAIIRIPIGS